MGDRLRVAVVARAVAPAHGLGGLERHVFDVVEHLRRKGVAVTLVTRSGASAGAWATPATGAGAIDGSIVGAIDVIEVPYLTFPLAGRRGTTILDRDTAYPLFGWRAGRRVRELVSRGAIDVVYGLGASVFGYALARGRRHGESLAPLVFNPQGLEEFGATNPDAAPLKRLAYAPLQAVVHACAQRADCVIATDRVLVDVVQGHLRLNAARIRVVPNAVDVERCDQLGSQLAPGALRHAHGIPDTHRLMLSVGRLEQNKGFQVLLQALTHLRADAGWTAIIVGAGPWASELQRQATTGGLGARVKFVGRQTDDELHGWYRAASVFVHPTLYEGSSLVTLEAMTHRLPVVGTTAGGLPDKVHVGVNGWLVPPNDARALADALATALQEPRLATLGAASRQIVEREFAWTSVADKLIAVFDEVRRAPRRGTKP